MGYAEGDSLDIRIQAAFGADVTSDPDSWSWTDVTEWWHAPDGVEISWGRSPGAEQAETSTLQLTLKNTDGRFSAHYPMSPHYPQVVQWTPIRVDIDLGDGEGWRNRFSGFVRAWPTEWPGRSGKMALTRIKAVGVLGRLQRGKPLEPSPFCRSIAASGPVAYWPCEDGVASGQVASALPGHPAMTVAGAVRFVETEDLNFAGSSPDLVYGSKSLIDLGDGASLSVAVPAVASAATTSTWTIHVAARVDIAFSGSDVVLLEWDTPGGTYVRWRLVWLVATSNTRVIAYTEAGAATTVINTSSAGTSFNIHDVSAVQNGGNIDVGLNAFGFVPGYGYTGTVAGTLAGITAVRINPTSAVITGEEFPVGHLAIWPVAPCPYLADYQPQDVYGHYARGARLSYREEAAHLRLERLAAEDGLTVSMPDVTDSLAVMRMGYQLPGASAPLYKECEDADGGLLYEDRFSLAYLPRAARYNPAVALTIDGGGGQLGGDFAPLADDQLLRNRVTVERVGGSSWVAEDAESIAASGAVDTSARLSLADDSRLRDQAGWRLHLLTATAREPRYGAISLALHAGARQLAADWCEVRPGSMVRVVNPPAQAPPGPVDQIVVGASERFTRTTWRVSMQTEPASPWVVAEADGDPRAPADGSTLAADLADGAMTLSLASTAANRPWTTDPADMPLDVRVGGERITVSAITGSTSPQTATITARGVNGVTRSWPAGTAVDVWDPAIAPL